MLQGFCLPALQPLLHLQHPYTPRRFGQPLRIRRSMQSEGMTALPSQWLPPMLIDFHPLIFTDHFSNVPYSKHYEPHLVIRFTRQLLDHAPEDSRSHLSTKSEKSLSRSFQTKSIILGYSDDFYWFLMYSIKAWHCRFWRKKSTRTALLQLAILARLLCCLFFQVLCSIGLPEGRNSRRATYRFCIIFQGLATSGVSTLKQHPMAMKAQS